jgi:hypothetical protein
MCLQYTTKPEQEVPGVLFLRSGRNRALLTSYNICQSSKMAVVVKNQNYQGDSAMQISILIPLYYVPKIFEKQDLAVAKAKVVVSYKHIGCSDYSRLCYHS